MKDPEPAIVEWMRLMRERVETIEVALRAVNAALADLDDATPSRRAFEELHGRVASLERNLAL